MDQDSAIRLIHGAKYFKALKPSDFTIGNTVNPKIWYQFQAFLDLVINAAPTQLRLDEAKDILK